MYLFICKWILFYMSSFSYANTSLKYKDSSRIKHKRHQDHCLKRGTRSDDSTGTQVEKNRNSDGVPL